MLNYLTSIQFDQANLVMITEVLNMNKLTNWETYTYVPSRERLEARLDDCLYEINWI